MSWILDACLHATPALLLSIVVLWLYQTLWRTSIATRSQCHHGFSVLRLCEHPSVVGYWGRVVSMPPQLCCFHERDLLTYVALAPLNATTALLLSAERGDEAGHHDIVSMLPRLCCFPASVLYPILSDFRLNATTALLLSSSSSSSPAS